MSTGVAGTESPRRLEGPVFWLALLLFVGLTAFLATHHEMWRDEVRAFSVAIRATSIPALFDALRVEGHPVLWYLVLAAGHSIFQSPLVLPIAAIVISTVAAAIVLRFAPFPLGVRLLAGAVTERGALSPPMGRLGLRELAWSTCAAVMINGGSTRTTLSPAATVRMPRVRR